MMRNLILFFLLLLSSPAWATNYCQDANNQGCWLYATGSGTTSFDTGANTSNNGTFTSGTNVTWSSTLPNAQYANSVQFNATSPSNISVTNATSLNFSGDLTICDWVRPNAATDFTDLEAKSNGTTGYYLQYSAAHWYTCALVSGSAFCAQSNSSVTDATWAHLCMVRSGSTITEYVNGVAQTSTGTQSGNLTNTANLIFGAVNSSGSNAFKGNVTGSGHFNRALSPTEISDIYNNGLAPLVVSHKNQWQGNFQGKLN